MVNTRKNNSAAPPPSTGGSEADGALSSSVGGSKAVVPPGSLGTVLTALQKEVAQLRAEVAANGPEAETEVQNTSALKLQMAEMRTVIAEQKEMIKQLLQRDATKERPESPVEIDQHTPSVAAPSNPTPSGPDRIGLAAEPERRTERRTVKSIPISTFSGKANERNSLSVRGFLYSVTRAGTMYKYSDSEMVELAECHFQGRAAAWITKLEASGKKPGKMSELRAAMLRQFVPTDEQARARNRLMDLQMKPRTTLESHINTFEDLMEICETPLNESYGYFFRSLPGYFKEELHKKFPAGVPPQEDTNLERVFEVVRTLDVARAWNAQSSKSTNEHNSFKGQHGDHKDKNWNATSDKKKEKRPTKDDSLASWGPAQNGERNMYRQTGRCMKCGKKGWNDPDHPCRKTKDGGDLKGQ